MLGGEDGNSRGQMQQLLNRSILIRMAIQDPCWAAQRYRKEGLEILSEVVITLKRVSILSSNHPATVRAE